MIILLKQIWIFVIFGLDAFDADRGLRSEIVMPSTLEIFLLALGVVHNNSLALEFEHGRRMGRFVNPN